MNHSKSGSEGTEETMTVDKRYPLVDLVAGELVHWHTNGLCTLKARVQENSGVLRQPAVHNNEQPTHIVVIGENDLSVGKVRIEGQDWDQLHESVNQLVDEEMNSL